MHLFNIFLWNPRDNLGWKCLFKKQMEKVTQRNYWLMRKLNWELIKAVTHEFHSKCTLFLLLKLGEQSIYPVLQGMPNIYTAADSFGAPYEIFLFLTFGLRAFPSSSANLQREYKWVCAKTGSIFNSIKPWLWNYCCNTISLLQNYN